MKVCEEYCSNYCHLPAADRGDSKAEVVMATNPEKIKQEALASLEQLTEMAEARLKDQITERQGGTMMMLTKTILPKKFKPAPPSF